MRMRARLGMEHDVIGTRLGKGGQERVHRGDHQMNVEGHFCQLAERFEHHRPVADIGHEMPVHDVQMQPIRTRCLDGGDLLAQSGEIRGQEGWSNEGGEGCAMVRF